MQRPNLTFRLLLTNSLRFIELTNTSSEIIAPDTMALRTLESRFEGMSVNDENDPGDGGKQYLKSKVMRTIPSFFSLTYMISDVCHEYTIDSEPESIQPSEDCSFEYKYKYNHNSDRIFSSCSVERLKLASQSCLSAPAAPFDFITSF